MIVLLQEGETDDDKELDPEKSTLSSKKNVKKNKKNSDAFEGINDTEGNCVT